MPNWNPETKTYEEDDDLGVSTIEEITVEVAPPKSEELAVIPPSPKMPEVLYPTHHAVALNSKQLQEANAEVKVFLEAKIVEFDEEIQELEASRALAKSRRWSTQMFWGPIYRATERKSYYVKLLAAVHAGYSIVPNMPCDWFAIRVDRDKPGVRTQTLTADYSFQDYPTVAPREPDLLKVGEGHYEAPTIQSDETRVWAKDASGKQDSLKALKIYNKFDPISFPLAAAHPVVMESTDLAMKQLIFDRIGIVPQSVKPKADPLIIGQIQARHDPEKFVSFLIGWYLDMRTL
jgi:hypothetical protein